MEARFKKIINPADASFIVKTDDIPAKNPWHYHPEIELLFLSTQKEQDLSVTVSTILPMAKFFCSAKIYHIACSATNSFMNCTTLKYRR